MGESTVKRSDCDTIRVPVLLGPTAVGKTDLAVGIAEDLGLDIISCDSRQIYRGMDIGTAKPTADERARVRHWLVDIVEPCAAFSAFDFANQAADRLRQLAAEGRQALVCGGSGLYFSALSEGLGAQGPSDTEYRREMERRAAIEGHRSIFDLLVRVDPASARRLHPNDTRRVIRALEVCHTTGVPLSELQRHTQPPTGLEFCVLIAFLPRPQLYARINERVDRMVAAGLWDEFLALRQSGYDRESPGLQCLGYRELFSVERQEGTVEAAVECIKRNTRRYAKRQITWFTNKTRATQVDLTHDVRAHVREHYRAFLQA